MTCARRKLKLYLPNEWCTIDGVSFVYVCCDQGRVLQRTEILADTITGPVAIDWSSASISACLSRWYVLDAVKSWVSARRPCATAVFTAAVWPVTRKTLLQLMTTSAKLRNTTEKAIKEIRKVGNPLHKIPDIAWRTSWRGFNQPRVLRHSFETKKRGFRNDVTEQSSVSLTLREVLPWCLMLCFHE